MDLFMNLIRVHKRYARSHVWKLCTEVCSKLHIFCRFLVPLHSPAISCYLLMLCIEYSAGAHQHIQKHGRTLTDSEDRGS